MGLVSFGLRGTYRSGALHIKHGPYLFGKKSDLFEPNRFDFQVSKISFEGDMGRRKVCWNTRGNKLAVVTNDGDDKKGEDSGRNIVVFDI